MKFFLDSLVNSARTSFQHLRIFLKGSKTRSELNETGHDHKLKPSSSRATSPSFATMKVSNQLEQVFNFIDSNGDGKISPLELRKLLLCLGHDKSKVTEEVQRMVKEADSNGDGYIDLNEYMKVVMVDNSKASNYHGSGGGDGGDHDIESRDHDHKHGFDEEVLMDVFLVFDADKNGLISARELSNVLNMLGFDHCGIEECLLMIKGVDKDGDGFVDFEEFKLMMSVQGFNPC
ncbi:hypothetical protein Droror1_Dr00004951 [Drosera rotundifolia]